MNVQLWSDLNTIDKAYSLPLMKISAYHKARGDAVSWHNPLLNCDRLYCSKVFSSEMTSDNLYTQNAAEVVRGGTGYDNQNKLPVDIEHQYPNYSLYPQLNDTAVGFCTRGCPNACPFCIVSDKEGRTSVETADVTEFWHGQKNITLFDPNVLACKERERIFKRLADTKAFIRFEQGLDARFIDAETISLLRRLRIQQFYFAWDLEKNSERIKAGLLKVREAWPGKDRKAFAVYVLVNYNTEWKFDIERIEWLRSHRFDPYVMVYEKWKADKRYLYLQRAVNNKILFHALGSLKEYKPLSSYLD